MWVVVVFVYSYLDDEEEINRDYSFLVGLEDYILGENILFNISILGFVFSEFIQSNISFGSSSSSGDVGKLYYLIGEVLFLRGMKG